MFIPLYCHVLPIIMDDEPTIGTSDPIFLGGKTRVSHKMLDLVFMEKQKEQRGKLK